MRIVKDPDVRRAEILATANQLFQTKGYTKTTVDEIVRQANIAKGTFYHYFKSKEEILNELTQQLVAEMAKQSMVIVQDHTLNAIEKLVAIINIQNQLATEKQTVVDSMHLSENRELHDRINIETVRVFGPILANVIEQGNQEKRFKVDDPLSTIQFILAGSQCLFGNGIFNWTEDEYQARLYAMLILIERTFAAKPGSIVAALKDCINNGLSCHSSAGLVGTGIMYRF